VKYTVLLEDIGQPLVGLAFLVLIYYVVGPWLPGVILSDIFSYAIAGFLGLLVVRHMFLSTLKIPIQPNYSIVKEVLAFSIPASLGGVFSVFVFWADRLVVGLFLSATETGLYQVVSQITAAFVILVAAFNVILGPIFAHLFTGKEYGRLEEIFRVGTKWNFYLSIPPFLVLMLFPRELLIVLFGTGYGAGWMALRILAVGQLINSATGSIGTLLVMTGNQKTWFFLSACALILNIVLCSIFTSFIGIVGAAVGTSITLGSMYSFAIFLGKRRLNIWPYDRRYLKGILAGLAAGLCGVGFRYLPLSSLSMLAGGCLVLLLVFAFALFLLKFDEEDLILISIIKTRLGIQSPSPKEK
jgi:O-antigen/teichoic acid export membrane protein